MQKSKRLLCLALAVSILTLATACGGNNTPQTDTSIATTDSTAETTADTGTSDTDMAGESTGSETQGSGSTATTTKANGTTTKKPDTTTKKPDTTTTTGAATSLTPDQFLAKMPAELKGTTLTFFFWEDLHHTAYKGAVEAFEKKTGITLKTEIANKAEYYSQLAARITAGQSPDLVKVIENNIGNITNLQPITNSGYDFNDIGWDKELMHDFTYNGRIYATNVQNTPNRNMAVMLYNKRALSRAKLEAPYEIWKKNPADWTWDKVWEMCEDFRTAMGNKDGYYGITFGVEDGYPRSFGAAFFRYDPSQGKFISLMKKSETAKRYEILVDAVNNQLSTSVWDSVGFEQGKVLFNWGYSSTLEKDNTTYAAMKKSGILGFVPTPTDSTEQPLFEYCAYGIPVGSKNAKAVPYFLRYAFAPETNDLDNFYISEEAREVCESMIKKGNFYFANGYNYSIWQQMLQGTASNVKAILDSNAGMIDDTVAIANMQLTNLPK